MEEYFTQLKESLLEILKKDSRVREGAFNKSLTSELFTDYILMIFFSSLTDTQQNSAGLLEIVKRCLY